MKKAHHKGHSKMEGLGKSPAYDWYFCLGCFAVALAVVALGDFAIYLNIMSATPASAGPVAAQAHVDRAEIELLAKKLKTMDMDAAGLSAAALRDPSLR